MAMLLGPVALAFNAKYPIATLPLAVVLLRKASKPMAVLNPPVVLANIVR